ncbi:MAG: hypothetical protein F4Y34_07050, partial [Gammaproteobacteria bacterium]|nr:hypothetical protein [Gammaproteobacteria bacterium]
LFLVDLHLNHNPKKTPPPPPRAPRGRPPPPPRAWRDAGTGNLKTVNCLSSSGLGRASRLRDRQ